MSTNNCKACNWDEGRPICLRDERCPFSPAPKLAGPQKPTVQQAMEVVTQAMRDDPEYAWSWHCNIAMAFVDEGGDPAMGNHAAARFMRLLANVEPAHELPARPEPALKTPSGWRLVPEEPTSEMLDQGVEQHTCEQEDRWYSNHPLSEGDAAKVYRAMVAAAPQPAAVPAARGGDV